MSALAQGYPLDADTLDVSKARTDSEQPNYGLMHGVDGEDLAAAGWGVIFAANAGEDLRGALEPLLKVRKDQAGKLYREYGGAQGYLPGDTMRAWLGRAPRLKGLGPVDPRRVPFYLLMVGDPEEIPFRFQYELDVNYAVGRICFDVIDDYRAYAESVVRAESTKRADGVMRHAMFFGARNPDDTATALSADHLIAPLSQTISDQYADVWHMDTFIGEAATRQRLSSAFTSGHPPSLLFSASHGMGFACGDPLQTRQQGALLCQDWPGPLNHTGPVPREFFFGADDLPDGASAAGMIHFAFACYGAGTPQWDEYIHTNGGRTAIAPRAFVAGLPRRLLSLRDGGALAFVGHVERVWSHSFVSEEAGVETLTFSSTIEALMCGKRLGNAMDVFGMKYADSAVGLTSELRDMKEGGALRRDSWLATLWTILCDARSFVVIGDPAVRIG
ncbi:MULTISPECIES: hypothetical protein [unclassified Caballeronia]|uniref:hypothetical protein n=1 Tax=unclassified Caballeronia TaxID=2646786 RepID=UPI00285D00E4|nr:MULTISPECIES: hypothetical protein [unclassified Caballeronia]MDR5753002.1 hypothetical protein [Caballeronia sp. LZ024]MDR5845101.1 hypothetical protein [Caballeronia sp. LZ031]